MWKFKDFSFQFFFHMDQFFMRFKPFWQFRKVWNTCKYFLKKFKIPHCEFWGHKVTTSLSFEVDQPPFSFFSFPPTLFWPSWQGPPLIGLSKSFFNAGNWNSAAGAATKNTPTRRVRKRSVILGFVKHTIKGVKFLSVLQRMIQV